MSIRSATSALMPLTEALARLLVAAPVPSSLVLVGEAVGLVLADDVAAATEFPITASARRDGWAVAGADVTGASAYAPVGLLSAPRWVEAGDGMPLGTDTVLPPEALDTSGEIVADAALGEGVSRGGQEIAHDDLLARSGLRLTPLGAVALEAAGIRKVAIRRPHILVIGIGDGPSSSVADAVAAWAVAAGGRVTRGRSARDMESIARAMTVELADAMFVVGGTGLGRTDHSAAALARRGRLDAHGIALRPGESTGFGWLGTVPTLLLPGRPDSALAAFLALGRPLLARLSGMMVSTRPKAPLSRKISSSIGMTEIVFARLSNGIVEPLGGADLPLRRLILAEGAVLVPPEREGYPEGELVEIIPL
ncbi:molybdopterin-binding protein [Methylobacterium sp. 77]|uniref:molybdopterin-binding protein n=1 Tax=Methylobacterium sp. 77 TaxID=1101192 RepID=UPI00036A814F|nr:molybdopterin-binding protein [Methylobacterium sp. 77]